MFKVRCWHDFTPYPDLAFRDSAGRMMFPAPRDLRRMDPCKSICGRCPCMPCWVARENAETDRVPGPATRAFPKAFSSDCSRGAAGTPLLLSG